MKYEIKSRQQKVISQNKTSKQKQITNKLKLNSNRKKDSKFVFKYNLKEIKQNNKTIDYILTDFSFSDIGLKYYGIYKKEIIDLSEIGLKLLLQNKKLMQYYRLRYICITSINDPKLKFVLYDTSKKQKLHYYICNRFITFQQLLKFSQLYENNFMNMDINQLATYFYTSSDKYAIEKPFLEKPNKKILAKLQKQNINVTINDKKPIDNRFKDYQILKDYPEIRFDNLEIVTNESIELNRLLKMYNVNQ